MEVVESTASLQTIRMPAPVNTEPYLSLLEQLQRGELDISTVASRLVAMNGAKTFETVDASVDLDRRRRCGFAEVVFCEGKTPESVLEIFRALRQHGEACLGTRCSEEQATLLQSEFTGLIYNPVARTVRTPREALDEPGVLGKVAVITAGTSDRPVAEEAVETLHWMGCPVELIVDVGVAGPHRIREQYDRFSDAKAIVVVAGMEGALPSVVGGFVDCPVIAVPTSVGYGASFGGVAALLGMLNSCASNVTVVNIDGGFKGGYVAGLIARQLTKPADRPPTAANRQEP